VRFTLSFFFVTNGRVVVAIPIHVSVHSFRSRCYINFPSMHFNAPADFLLVCWLTDLMNCHPFCIAVGRDCVGVGAGMASQFKNEPTKWASSSGSRVINNVFYVEWITTHDTPLEVTQHLTNSYVPPPTTTTRARAHTYAYTRARAHTHTRAHTRARARTHTRAHTLARAHTHTHTHTHAHTHTTVGRYNNCRRLWEGKDAQEISPRVGIQLAELMVNFPRSSMASPASSAGGDSSKRRRSSSDDRRPPPSSPRRGGSAPSPIGGRHHHRDSDRSDRPRGGDGERNDRDRDSDRSRGGDRRR